MIINILDKLKSLVFSKAFLKTNLISIPVKIRISLILFKSLIGSDLKLIFLDKYSKKE